MKNFGKKQPSPSATSPPPKHKKSRFFLKLFLGLAGLFALLIILFLSVDLNTFREPIAKALSQAAGMKIKIESLDWTFSEGLKIDCKGVQIFSGETEEELVSTKELLISLNWLPLLEKRIVVDSISLVEPVLKISVKPSSVNDPLPPLEKKSGSDAKSNSSASALNKSSSPDALQTVRELLKNPNFTLTAINLIAGRVVIQDKGTGKEIAFDTEARMQIQRDENRIGLTLEGIKLGTGNLIAEGEIRSDNFLSANSPMQAHIRLNPFKMADLLPALEWVPKSRDAVYRKLKLKGNVHTLDLKLKTPIDSVMDLDSLMSSAGAALTLKGKELSLVQYGNIISASTLDTDIEWRKQRLIHKIVLGTLGGTVETHGQIVLTKGTSDSNDWKLDSKLTLAKINLRDLKTQFFNQTDQFPEKGIVSADFHIQGPVLHPNLIRGNGSINMQDLVLPVNGTVISVVDMKGKGKWLGDRLNHQFHLTALGGEMTLEGDLRFKRDKQGQWNPMIDSDVIPKSIKLAQLRPLVQKEWFPEKGTLTGDVHVNGPVLLPDAIQGKGHLNFSNLEVTVNNAAIVIPAMEFNGTWANSRLIHDLKLKVLDGNIQTKGQLLLKKDRQGNRDSVLDSKIFIKQVSLKELKPLVAKNWFPHKGILDGVLQVQGSVARPQAMKAKGKLGVRNAATQFGGKNITLSHIESHGSWQKDNLKHHITAKIFGGEVSLKGDLNFKKNKQGELDPIINSEVVPKSIQLSKLRELIAKDWFPETGAVTGSIRLKGPVARFSEVALTGKLAGSKIRLNLQEKPVVIRKTLLSFKPNAKYHNQIGFSLSEISIGDIELKKSIGSMVYSPKTVELTQGKIWPKTGQVSLNGNYEFETKDYKLKFTGDGLRLEDYKGEFLEGPLAFKGNLFGKVLTKGFKKGLSGNVKVRSENSKLLKAGDALAQIANALNLKFLQGAEKKVAIDFLGGDCTIKNGVLTTKNFRMLSPPLKVWVNGNADLSEEILKAEAMAIPKQSTEKVFKKVDKEKERLKKKMKEVPLLDKILGGSKDQGGVVDEVFSSIPLLGSKDKKDGQPRDLLKFYFAINGPFDKLKVKLEPEKSLGFK